MVTYGAMARRKSVLNNGQTSKNAQKKKKVLKLWLDLKQGLEEKVLKQWLDLEQMATTKSVKIIA